MMTIQCDVAYCVLDIEIGFKSNHFKPRIAEAPDSAAI